MKFSARCEAKTLVHALSLVCLVPVFSFLVDSVLNRRFSYPRKLIFITDVGGRLYFVKRLSM